MWTRIPYSARIGLPIRQYIGEAARNRFCHYGKTRTEKTGKTARNATEFLISVDLGKVWPPLGATAVSARVTAMGVHK